MRNSTVAPPTNSRRELIRDLLGDEATDALSDAGVGRVLAAVFSTARREIERENRPGQLEFHA